MLRTDRVKERVSSGQYAHLNCSIIGSGDMAQINCDSSTSTSGDLLIYQVALLVGSNQVGYIIACGGTLLGDVGCERLTAGESLHGFVEGRKFSSLAGSKMKRYRVISSQYIGSLTQDKGSETPASSPSAVQPVELSRPSEQIATQGETADVIPNTGSIAFTSEPRGADIYIDGKFVGNTPSVIQLSPGRHAVRIEAPRKQPWSRTLNVTAGSKVTVQATFTPQT